VYRRMFCSQMGIAQGVEEGVVYVTVAFTGSMPTLSVGHTLAKAMANIEGQTCCYLLSTFIGFRVWTGACNWRLSRGCRCRVKCQVLIPHMRCSSMQYLCLLYKRSHCLI